MKQTNRFFFASILMSILMTACGGGGGGSNGGDTGFIPSGPCDSTLMLDSSDPVDAAKAMGICDGLVSAAWELPDGTTTTNANFSMGYGILPDFTSSSPTREGEKLLVLSSGTARRPSDPGYYGPTETSLSSGGFEKNTTHGFPVADNLLMPTSLPGCQQPTSAHDGVMLKVILKVPDGVDGWAFDFRYFTADYPDYNCTQYVDQAAAIVTDSTQTNQYVLYDKNSFPVFSDATLEACTPTIGYLCPLGPSDLVGTGFDNHGATAWTTTLETAIEGDTVTIKFMIWDSTDASFDSTILFDNFRWLIL